jgi:hypothetical protein
MTQTIERTRRLVKAPNRFPGVYLRVIGPVLEEREEWFTATDWAGTTYEWPEVIEEDTGQLYVVMVGDDHKWIVDPGDLEDVPEDEDYCGCGQIGCPW